MNIHKRILLLLLAVGLLTFVALGLVFLRSLYDVQQQVQESSDQVETDVVGYAEDMTVTKTKAQIVKVAEEKTRQVERELNMIREDTEYLADAMTRIMAQPEYYAPRRLPTAQERRIASGEAYLLVMPRVREECATEAVQHEIGLAANIADDLEVTSLFYKEYNAPCYITSTHGYFINCFYYNNPEDYDGLHAEKNYREVDLRERSWFQRPKAVGRTVFSDMYVGYEGVMEFTCSSPYYYPGGDFAGVAAIDLRPGFVYRIIADKSLGSNNINFMLGRKGEILLSTEQEGALAVGDGHRNLCQSEDASLAQVAKDMVAGHSDIVLVNLGGEEYYLAYVPLPSMGWSYGTLVQRSEVLSLVQLARESLTVHTEKFIASLRDLFFENIARVALFFLVVLAVLIYGSRRAAEVFVRPILTLTEGVRDIARGELDKKIVLHTGDEIEELSDSVNNMTSELRDYMTSLVAMTEDRERIATELNLAKGIQEGMLPNIFPKFVGNPHYDLYVRMETAKEVGGDFYDFYYLDEDHVVLTIADVSGKGIPAALFMVISKTMLKNEVLLTVNKKGIAGVDCGRILERVNQQLCDNNEEMMFVTVFFGVLNIKTGAFAYANGGHNPPLLGSVAEDGTIRWQYLRNEGSFMLGVIKDSSYEEGYLTMNPGEMLYFYTDGVTEAMDGQENMYTEERLQETLASVVRPGESMEKILARVHADIDSFAGGAEQSDDITMLGVRFLG